MSQLQVTKITTVDNTTPLILATGNAGGGQIIIQSSNTDVMFSGNINFTGTVTGDGSGLFLSSSNVANMAFNTANAAFASANNVAPQVTPAYNTANVAFDTANAAFASANNVAPQVTPAFNTANVAFDTANAAFASANNVAPQIAPAFTTANSAFSTANLASNTAINAYNTSNAAYTTANAAYAAANTKFSSSGGTITGAVEIIADLTVHGNTRFIDQQTLSVGDPLIYLAANNYSSDVVDIGFVANYVNATSANVHTGLYRSSGTKEYYLFQGYDKEPYNNYIDPTGNNISMAVLNSTLRTSNLILGGANTINWIKAAYNKANAGGANVGQTTPVGAATGSLWWNSDLGKMFIYYTDPANTSSWVETSPSASAIEGAIITGYINPVYNTTNAAFSKANSALPNTTNAVFQGNLTVTGALTVGTGTTTITSNTINIANTFKVTSQGVSIPSGNTAQRPGSSTTGTLRFNNETGYLEQYTSDGWNSISTPPVISNVSPSTFNGEQGTTFTINGSNFDGSPVVKFVNTSGTEYAASVTTRVSGLQLTATTPQDFTVADEPLKVKVINNSGLSFTLDSAIDCGGVPAWSNSSGSLGSTIGGANTGLIATAVATDPDAGATLSYSLTSGSLPAGCYLGSSNGNIFGTTSFSESNSTYSFTLTATDNAGNQTPRSFSILVERGVESGGGAGYLPQYATKIDANNITSTSMTLYYANAQAASPNNPTQWLNYTWSSGNFMIHTGHDGVKPTYLCFNLTSGNPRVLNRFRWLKHANACGNIDFYGSNQAITSGNYQTMSNWSYLGRGFMGGSGSATDGTAMPAAFNSNNYGFRWYMVLVRDIGGSLAYPSEGSMGGYAMYGATFDCV